MPTVRGRVCVLLVLIVGIVGCRDDIACLPFAVAA